MRKHKKSIQIDCVHNFSNFKQFSFHISDKTMWKDNDWFLKKKLCEKCKFKIAYLWNMNAEN